MTVEFYLSKGLMSEFLNIEYPILRLLILLYLMNKSDECFI